MNSNSGKSESGQSCEFQENLGLLRQIPMFSPLPLDALKVLAYLCGRDTFRPGDALFQQGEDDGQAFYIITGTARRVHTAADGEIAIADHTAGDFVGGLALLGKTPRLFTLRALTPVTCLILTRDRFSKAIAQFPEVMPRILNGIVDRIHRWEKRFLAHHGRAGCDCYKSSGVSLI